MSSFRQAPAGGKGEVSPACRPAPATKARALLTSSFRWACAALLTGEGMPALRSAVDASRAVAALRGSPATRETSQIVKLATGLQVSQLKAFRVARRLGRTL